MRASKFLFFIFLVLSHSVAANVHVVVEDKTLSFDSPVRLDAVLALSVPEHTVYWPAAALYRLEDSVALTLRAKVLSLLEELGELAAPEQQILFKQLALEINTWVLAQRLPVKIDYDKARLSLAANPLLPVGNYLLHTPTRPKNVFVFGAITHAARVLPHKPVSSSESYLYSVTKQSANHNVLTVIQADGRVIPVAVYGSDYRFQEVQPGGAVFVPFKSSLFDNRFTELNNVLIELFSYRVAP